MSYKNDQFKENPNLKYKENICKIKYSTGFNDLFEVFTPINNNEKKSQYIVYPNDVNTNLIILELTKKQIFLELKGHNKNVIFIKYYSNKKKNNISEYLLSSDMDNIAIVWDINNNYSIKFTIETKYHVYMYSSLILFSEKNNYVITSTTGKYYNRSDFSRLYSLEDGKYIKNIFGTNKNSTTYIIPWFNKNYDEYYLIEFCREKISINSIEKDEIYYEYEKKKEYNKYFSGFIYNKNNTDYVVSCSYNGTIEIFDLFDKILIKKIKIDYSRLHTIISWNERYIIFADYNREQLNVIDMIQFKVITAIKTDSTKKILCLKKINHAVYGESIISFSDNDGNINLWSV